VKIMRRNLAILIAFAVALFIGASTAASAQGPYYGVQPTLTPNYGVGTFTATATSQTSSVFPLAGFSGVSIAVYGTSLTTATWALQGTNDGTHWFPLLLAAVAVPGTTATTETTTATSMYIANVAHMTQIRLVTSGTFTATSVTFNVVASSNRGLL